jgi:Fe-S-cluster containining protein
MGSPPFNLWHLTPQLLPGLPAEIYDVETGASPGADVQRFLGLPEGVRAELAGYLAAVFRGEIPSRHEQSLPCLWFDPQTRLCRHYESRPKVCRDHDCLVFEPGRACGRRAPGYESARSDQC